MREITLQRRRNTSLKFLNLMKIKLGKSFLKSYENEKGLHIMFAPSVLLCTPGRPICITVPCILRISNDDYQSADIMPCYNPTLLANWDYVGDICWTYRRILSEEGIIQCARDGNIDNDISANNISIYYLYRGLYKFNTFLKNPKLISPHMNAFKRDLSLFYSMIMNQFGLTNYDIEGCTTKTAPSPSDTIKRTSCQLCKGCCDWRY